MPHNFWQIVDVFKKQIPLFMPRLPCENLNNNTCLQMVANRQIIISFQHVYGFRFPISLDKYGINLYINMVTYTDTTVATVAKHEKTK